MKRKLLFAISLVASLYLTSSFSLQKQESIDEIEDRVLQLVNQQRVSNGKPELIMNEVIRAEARQHSQNMASGDTAVGHEGFEERNDRIKSKIRLTRMAENVAYNYIGASVSVEQWLNSIYQRKIMLGDFRKTGIGVAKRGCDYYFTEIFTD